MLVLTLILMGAATTLIGFLPTYETAGIVAPVMLLLLQDPARAFPRAVNGEAQS